MVVVAAEGFEARRKQGDAHVGHHLVVAAVESGQCGLVADVGIHEGGAAVAGARVVEEHVGEAEVAVHAHVDVAGQGYGDVRQAVCCRRVGDVAVEVAVGEVGGGGLLGHGGSGIEHGQHAQGEYLVVHILFGKSVSLTISSGRLSPCPSPSVRCCPGAGCAWFCSE